MTIEALLPEGYEEFDQAELEALAATFSEQIDEIRNNTEKSKPSKQILETLKAIVEARKSVQAVLAENEARVAEFAALLEEEVVEEEIVAEVSEPEVVEAEVEVAEEAEVETVVEAEVEEVVEAEVEAETEIVEAEVEAVETEVVEAEVEVAEVVEAEAVEAEVEAEVEIEEVAEVVETEVAENNEEIIETAEVVEVAEAETTPEGEQIMSDVEGALEKPEFSIGGLAEAPASNVIATGAAYTKTSGDTYNSLGDLAAELITQFKRGGGERRWSNIGQAGVRDEIRFASVNLNDEANIPMLSTVNEAANYNTLTEAVKEHKAGLGEKDILVASGGICAPFQQDYSFFRLAEPHSPVEGAFPRVGAPRGGIKFILPPDFTDARAAITTVTEAQDALGYVSTPDDCLPGTRDVDGNPGAGTGIGATPDKPCACVACPDVAECVVTAVPWCVRWGNFNYYTFPELVENFMSDLMVNYAAVKEVFYLDALLANSTVVTAAAVYGATTSILSTVARAAVNYRKRHSMAINATLNLFAPDWLVEVIKNDLANAHGRDRMYVTDAEVISLLRNLNVNVSLYYHTPSVLPGGVPSQAFDGAQAAGALNAWPTKALTFLHAPGTFIRLDGGSLDFGMVRDSSLIATNDFIVAAEQFTGLCKVGLESLAIVHDIKANGSGGAATAAF